VKAMPLGDKVEIKLKTGRTVKGALESASDSVITLRRDNNAATIKRDEVQRVLRVTERSSRKPVLVGAAVGAGIGAVGTGIAAAGSSGSGDDQVIFVVLSSLALAGVGALVGTLFMKKKRSVLVYETQ
jgi:small nuclear ribonucleoprotein (snRNP)-like protein